MPDVEVVYTDPTPVVGLSVGGLTYGAAKSFFAKYVDNGVCEDEPRVLPAVNLAIQLCLNRIIPVGGMATYDVQAAGITLILPPELLNIIEAEVLDGAKVDGSTDIVAGHYDLVNPFTYVHPNASHGNPWEDKYDLADPDDPTILRRMYDYPGLTPNSLVRVTGAKRYIPMTGDDDYLIVQNIWAIACMLMSMERLRNGNVPEAKTMKDEAYEVLTDEVKKYQLDPTNVMKRKGAYNADLAANALGTYAHTRATLAHLLPGGLMMGKDELSRLLDISEMRLLARGQWKGTLETFTATVDHGMIAMPERVDSVVAAEGCGTLDIRSIFYQYKLNGCWGCCDNVLEDQGEIRFGATFRRCYKLKGYADADAETCCGFNFKFVGKLRWWKKRPDEYMTIRNTEAHRLMVMAVLAEEDGKDGTGWEDKAVKELDRELREYLTGIHQQLTIVHDEDYSCKTGQIL